MSQREHFTTVSTTQPDYNKLLKCVQDALNKIIWRDDTLVFNGATEVRYDDPPKVEIVLRFPTETELQEQLANENQQREGGEPYNGRA